jgi:integrase
VPQNAARPRLLDQVRDRIRFKHYSLRTEQAYVGWSKRVIRFHGNRHPSDLSSAHVEAFLTHLAVDLQVAASTQNQAQSALLFLYREVLAHELPLLDGVRRAKMPVRLPVVLTREKVARVLDALHGPHRLFGKLLYGTGLRIMEAARLRIKDVDLARRTILVRNGKGGKDWIYGASRASRPATPRAFVEYPGASCARPSSRIRRRLAAAGARTKIPERCSRWVLAVRLSRRSSLA